MLALPPDLFQSPSAAVAWAGEALGAAVDQSDDPLNLLAFAYTPDSFDDSFDGGMGLSAFPSLKTVVLRHFDAASGTFAFYTDTRSAKWRCLTAVPDFQALFYCPQRWLQISVCGTVSLQTATAFTQELFDALSPSQRQAYTSKAAPGSAFGGDDPTPLKQDAPALAAQYFGRVECQAHHMDVVSLHRKGHQRVLATWEKASKKNREKKSEKNREMSAPQTTWCVP